jgi:ribosomal protein L29
VAKTKEELDNRITELEEVIFDTEAVITDKYTKPDKLRAAERYIAGARTELSKVKAERN